MKLDMRKSSRKNTIVVIIAISVLVILGVVYLYGKSGGSPSVSKISMTEKGIFEGVPTDYSECMRTDEKYNFQQRNRSDLKCEYLVSGGVTGKEFMEGDKTKFDKCEQMSGKNLTYEVSCGLVFYNPNYVFPKSFEECVKEKKGEFTTSVEPRCIIEIDGSLAYNTEIANNLINQCVVLGGSYSEQFGRRCYMEFSEKSISSQQTKAIKNTKDCKITGQAVEGPYYRPEAPFRTALAPINASGRKLLISGTVYTPDCKTPLAGALVDVWHADTNGAYDETSPDYLYRGRMLTDQNGHYQFETILPGYYRLGSGFRPRHIHFKVSKPNYRLLTTQLYFSGDPYLMPNDACVTCGSDDPTLIIPLEILNKDQRAVEQNGIFNIFLAK